MFDSTGTCDQAEPFVVRWRGKVIHYKELLMKEAIRELKIARFSLTFYILPICITEFSTCEPIRNSS